VASRVRLEQIATSGEPNDAAAAVDDLDLLLAGAPVDARGLLLRARLGVRSGQAGLTLAALDELSRELGRSRGLSGALATQGLALLRGLPESSSPRLRREIEARLVQGSTP
jgi:hypothetical protein